MADRILLPTKAQVGVISDIGALKGLRDEIERAVVDMETRLEFDRGDDPTWAGRAKSALSLHRYTDRLLERRIGELRGSVSKAAHLPRPETDNDALTNEVLAARPEVDAYAIATVEEVDDRAAWITARIIAAETDRNDEIALPPQERDEGFLVATGSVIKAMKAIRIALSSRRGQITREARRAAHAIEEARRERMFIDAAREVLPKATYDALWLRVDRQMAEAA